MANYIMLNLQCTNELPHLLNVLYCRDSRIISNCSVFSGLFVTCFKQLATVVCSQSLKIAVHNRDDCRLPYRLIFYACQFTMIVCMPRKHHCGCIIKNRYVLKVPIHSREQKTGRQTGHCNMTLMCVETTNSTGSA